MTIKKKIKISNQKMWWKSGYGFYSWEPHIVGLWYFEFDIWYMHVYGWLIFKRKWKVKCKRLQYKLNCKITTGRNHVESRKVLIHVTRRPNCKKKTQFISISLTTSDYRLRLLSTLKYRSRLRDMRQDAGKCAENVRFDRYNFNCCVCLCVLESDRILCGFSKHCSEWPRQH